jgi:hypothetical protein
LKPLMWPTSKYELHRVRRDENYKKKTMNNECEREGKRGGGGGRIWRTKKIHLISKVDRAMHKIT